MNFDDIVKKRKSVRSFKSTEVSYRDILDAIDAAAQGPISGNKNNFKYVIVENPDTIKMIAKYAEQPWIDSAKVLIVLCSNDFFMEEEYGERGRIYSRQQAGAAISTILLKLTELGLGSCWVGAYSDDVIKKNLEIPDKIQIEGIIAAGYEKVDPLKGKKPKKETLDRIIYWEAWDTSRRETLFKESHDRYSLDQI